ncbi:MAG: hypothetical protein AB7F36_17125 [Reyranellaceae bacterium]
MSASSTEASADASHSTERQLLPRPGHYTAATGREICRRLAEGQSLRAICADRTMPCWETVRRWLRQRPKFRADYAEAREHQADWLAAEALDAARQVTPATATATRVLLAELHWQAARLRPRVYGERPAPEAQAEAEDEIAATLRAALARAEQGDASALPSLHENDQPVEPTE